MSMTFCTVKVWRVICTINNNYLKQLARETNETLPLFVTLHTLQFYLQLFLKSLTAFPEKEWIRFLFYGKPASH